MAKGPYTSLDTSGVADTHEQVWAQTFERLMPADSYYDFQQYVVDRVLASIMGLRGAISRYQIDRIENARYRNPAYFFLFSIGIISIAGISTLTSLRMRKLFYNEVITRDPSNALAYAYLSQINSGELLMNPARPGEDR